MKMRKMVLIITQLNFQRARIMTRTEIQRRELEETARHNKQQEAIDTAKTFVSGIGTLGTVARGAGGLISGVASAMKPASPKNIDNHSEHYHMHKH